MRFKLVALTAAVLATGQTNAAIVTFTDHFTEGYVDVFYTVSPGGEFTNWDLLVELWRGSVLDPNKGQKSFNAQSGAAPLDTFANTVFSSVGAGAAQYIHTSYNPGSAFPPLPSDPLPTAGGTPATLNWSIFDTATGDTNISGFFPYHMARIVFSQHSIYRITAHVYDTSTIGVGERFTFEHLAFGNPMSPEPSAALMMSLAVPGLIAARRKLRGVT